MAKNLLAAGFKVTVFDLNTAAAQSVAAEGAVVADSAAEAVAGSDCVVSMLPAGKHVAAVYLGQDGLLNDLPGGALIIDCSTIDVATAREVAQAAEARGVLMLDAPVSGGVAGAAAGTLSFMCGGSEEAFDQAQPVLRAMGKNVFHAGDSGAGQIAKMCNNMLLSIIMIGTSEALQLGTKSGMDPKVLSDIMQASTGRNWTLECYNPCPGVMDSAPASNDYRPGFMVDLMCKDLGLAMENAEQVSARTPLGKMARELYEQHASAGQGQRDFASIYTTLE